MSSSSSSDCECEDYCLYAAGYYENYGGSVNRTPYYPTMGHPLIYYTQTNPYYQPQPVNRRQSRKRDPNCFVKAFRWYTQERCNKNSSNPQTNGTEFASWLDMKYDEYICSKPNQQDSYKLTLKQTSVIKAEKTFQSPCADSCPNNFKTKFKRLKSPWNKKHRGRGDKESGDIVTGNQSCQSCQYILQPKDLIRPSSECCQSSVITVSNDSQKKTVVKSRSLVNLRQDQSKNEPIEAVLTQEGVQLKKDSTYKEDSPMNKKSVTRAKSGLVNVSCHCSIYNIDKVDAETQYENVILVDTCSSRSILKQTSSIKPCQALKEASQTTSPTKTFTVYCECGRYEGYKKPVTKTSNVDAFTQYESHGNEGICNKALCQAVEVPKPPPRKCPCEMEPEEFMVPLVAALPKLTNIGAQTSDRSITFEKGSPYNYPLFMKIICADKLIEENSK